MKQLHACSLISILSIFLFASLMLPIFGSDESLIPPSTEWSQTYGGNIAYCVKQTTDSGFVLAGGNYFWLAKTDLKGNLQWSKSFGTELSIAYSVVQTSDGGYALAGEKYYYGGGKTDFWLVKTDSTGEMEWNQTYGGMDWESAHSVIQTFDGGYALTGYIEYLENGKRDFLLVKTDSFGNMEWNQTYGSPENDQAYSVVQTSDGGYAVAGYMAFNNTNFCLIKTDSSGKVQWNQTYEGLEDRCYSMMQTNDGGYILAGETWIYDKGRAYCLVKADANGNMKWNRIWSINYGDVARSVIQTTDGGYMVAGYTHSYTNSSLSDDAWLIKTDSLGNMNWNHTYGGINDDAAYCVIQTSDEGYAIAGFTQSSNAWLAKISRGNAPIANFTYSPIFPSIDKGITFDASFSSDIDDDIVSYRWNFDDGNITSTTNSTIVHIYEAPRAYNVTLTVVDSKGLESSHSEMIYPKILTYISLSTSSSTAYAGFTVNITGGLHDMYGNGLENETVILHYSFAGLGTWTPIASGVPDDLGSYHISWLPSATGNYELKAEWSGNATHYGVNKTSTLSSLAFDGQYVFTVESNSTISALAFGTEKNTLSFTATGPNGTSGFTKVTVAKNLIGDIAGTQVILDGNQLEYSVTSLEDSWVLHFTYQHSSHNITINLSATLSFFGLSPMDLAIIGIVIAVICVIAVFLVLRRKRVKKA